MEMNTFITGIFGKLNKVTYSPVDEILILDGMLYYISSGQLYRCKIDGTGEELMFEGRISSLRADGKYLYFTNEYAHGSICRIDLNGT